MTRRFSSGLVVIPNLFRDLGFGFRFFVLKPLLWTGFILSKGILLQNKFIFLKEEDVNCKITRLHRFQKMITQIFLNFGMFLICVIA